MKKTIGYVRVSTDKQVTDGVSLDTQAERIKAYCEFKGLELVDIIHDDGISGGVNRARVGFNELLDRIEAGNVSALVLFSLERLSRDMLTLLSLERLLSEYDVELHTVDGAVDTSTPDGFLNFGMKAFLAEFERRQVKYRTKANMQHLKGTGRLVGAVPYGFKAVTEIVNGKDVKTLVPDSEEQSIIETVNEYAAAGGTLTEIIHTLTAQGARARNGKPFTAMQIKRMIRDYQDKWTARTNPIGNTIRGFLSAIG